MNTKNILIRQATAADFNDIIEIQKEAFGYDGVAALTADLLGDPTAEPKVSLLAIHDGRAIGHILFTRATIDEHPEPRTHILAPLAVRPEYHGQGVGGLLTTQGISRLREIGTELVFVLGHRGYYSRHGFIPNALAHGFPAPYPIRAEVADCWMVMPLSAGARESRKGTVRCSAQLDKPEHWREE